MSKNDAYYSKGEEIFNGVTHIIGGALGIFTLFYFIVFSIYCDKKINLFALLVYSFTLILLYTISTLYHMLRASRAKKIFRILDHCSIYLLIAGTYTPYILIGLNNKAGYITLLFVWCISILGIVLNSINMHNIWIKVFSYISYFVLGWCIIFNCVTLIENIGQLSFLLLLIGGIAYTIGIIFYGFGKKKKWFHSIWHLFVLAGSILHFISIIYMIM